MNENQLTLVEKYENIDPLIHKKNSIFDNCIRDCQNKCFHTFGYKCVLDFKLTIIGNNEVVNLTIAEKGMNLYELKKNQNFLEKMV